MLRELRHRRVELAALVLALSTVMGPIRSFAEDAPKAGAAAPADAKPAAPAGKAPGKGQPGADPSTYGLADVTPFTEHTAVNGKPDVNLQGVWLVVANIEVIPGKGKFRTFPQLVKITQGKDGPEFHMLDVQLPSSVQQSLLASQKTMSPWVPSADVLKTLAESWSTLPPYKQKNVQELLYEKIEYTVISPDQYAEGVKEKTEGVKKTIDGTKAVVRIVENYKPRDLPADTHVSQLMQRTSIYGLRTVDKDTIKGDLTAGFLAAGAGFPMPFDFPGQFGMYKVASL